MPARLIPGSIFIGLLVFLLSGCSSDSGIDSGADSARIQEAKAKTLPREKSIKVDVGRTRQGDLVLPVYADGAIRTPQSVQVKARLGGQLTEVLVRNGDQVQEGQLLARTDPREYRILLEESRYRHLKALSQIAAEIDTYVVDQKALDNFYAAKRKLDAGKESGALGGDVYQSKLVELEMNALCQGAFREEVLQQRTGLAEARMAEERARLDLDNTEIRAPFSGMVQDLGVVTGEMLSTGAVICRVLNNSRLEAIVNVLEVDLGNLAEGRPALLAIPSTGDTLETIIDVISPTLDAVTRTCQLIFRFDNPEGRLRSGMFVRAQIAGCVHRDKLLVPRDALLVRDSRSLVFKREDDRASCLYVDTGLENDDWVEILQVHDGGSLDPQDEVVVSDHQTLANESKIKVRNRVPPADKWAFAPEAAAAKAATALYETRARLLELGHLEEAWDVGGVLVTTYPDSPEAVLVLDKADPEATATTAAASLYETRARLLESGHLKEAWDVGGELVTRYPDSPESAWVLGEATSGATAN